jgi:hypothetical protein
MIRSVRYKKKRKRKGNQFPPCLSPTSAKKDEYTERDICPWSKSKSTYTVALVSLEEKKPWIQIKTSSFRYSKGWLL